MSNIIDWITDIILWLSFGVKELAVVLVSMVPIIELRSGIPVGIKLGLGEWESFLLAFLGSSLVCIPLLLVFRPFFDWAKKWKGIGKFFVRVEEVFRQKAGNMGLLGVFVLAALPIPGTGVWTSSIVAVILGLKFWKAAAVIIGGNLIAGGAMLGLTALFGKHNLDILLFILCILFVILLAWFVYKVFTVNKNELEQNETQANESVAQSIGGNES